MNETQFLEAYDKVGSFSDTWFIILIYILSLIALFVALTVSLVRENLNNERSSLIVGSIFVIVFTMFADFFLVGNGRSELVGDYTKNIPNKEVTVESISYGNNVEFTYKDNDGASQQEQVDSVLVTYIRDLKNGEPVRVDFKEIDIKTIKANEAPNGLYDVKVHVPNDFKE